jgi:hypothetical protein
MNREPKSIVKESGYMTVNQVVRTSAMLGIIGSILAVVNLIGRLTLGMDYANNALNLTFVYLDNLSMSLMIIGLIATYFIQNQDLGTYGLFSFVLALIGAMWVQGYSALGFATPVIKDLNSSWDIVDFPNYPFPLLQGILSITILAGVGIILYGLSLLLHSKISRWPGVVLIIGGLSSALQVPFGILGLVSSVAFIVAILALSIIVWSKTRQQEVKPSKSLRA